MASDNILKSKSFINFEKDLKAEQFQCLSYLQEKKDLMVILPTGFGKSLIYQLSPFVLSLKDGIDLQNIHYFTLVITPLSSIMVDQCQTLTDMGIKACALDYVASHGEFYKNFSDNESSDSESETDESSDMITSVSLTDIANGKYQIVFAHPEALISSESGRRLLRRDGFMRNLACIAIDEAHMILEWSV